MVVLVQEDVAPGEVAAGLWRHPDAPASPVADHGVEFRMKNLAAGIAKKRYRACPASDCISRTGSHLAFHAARPNSRVACRESRSSLSVKRCFVGFRCSFKASRRLSSR
eukprot:jgi/Tetstr1/458675/TSEL_045065.t1